MAAPIAVVVQCFNKPDTVRGVLESLCKCEGASRVDLIVWQDGVIGSRRQSEFEEPCNNVREFVTSFASEHKEKFSSIEVYENAWNLGPYKTCKVAMDLAFINHDLAILTEDDVIFSRDALVWFSELRDAGLLEQENVWAIAAESIFFDAREKTVDPSFIEAALAAAAEQQLINKYTAQKFIPSSCFATSRRRWSEFGETRGETNGDVTLCRRCEAENRRCVAPVIARGKDVGMLHDLGYSVSIHTKVGVLSAAKHTYLLAEDMLPNGPVRTPRLEPFEGDQGLLFRQSTGLEGFGQARESDPEITQPSETFEDRIGRARSAFESGDLPEALRRWDVVLSQFPGEMAGLIGKGETLRDLGRLDEAEAMFAAAIERFPNSEWPAARHAGIAVIRGDLTTALSRWDAVRERFPDRPVGHIGVAEVLREMGRLDDAEEAFSKATRLFPDSEWAATHYAEIALRRQEWTEALRRWESVTEKFPDHADSYIGLAAALRGLARLDEADAVLAQAVVRFTRNHWVAIGYAQTAVERRDWARAVYRWDLVLQRFPHEAAGHIGKATALIEAGRLDEAERVLNAAAVRFPTDQLVARGLSTLAVRRAGAIVEPTPVRALSSKLKMYSQFGEDGILQAYFRGKWWQQTHRMDEIPPSGFYIDIGAHHPYFISNTWSFYKNGWCGINVEPTPGAIDEFNNIRPRDINLQMAISGKDGEATLYSYGRSVMNTLSPEFVKGDQKPEEIIVPAMRLESLLDKYLPKDISIDFLSVDVEGLDLYRPDLALTRVGFREGDPPWRRRVSP